MAVVLIAHVPSREAYEQVADNQAPLAASFTRHQRSATGCGWGVA
jgi:hypothetical protein